MKVGDLVKVKQTGAVALVTQIKFAPNFYKSVGGTSPWVFLFGHDSPYKPHGLEAISGLQA